MTDEHEKSRLILHPNRWVSVVFDDGRRSELHPPNIDEFREIREAYAAAEETYHAQVAEKLREKAGTRDTDLKVLENDGILMGKDRSPYAEAFVTLLTTLTDMAAPDSGKMPLWASRGGVYLVVAAHWRNVEVVTAADDEAAKTQAKPITPMFDPQPQGPQPMEGVAWPEVLEGLQPPPDADQQLAPVGGGMAPGPVR